MNDFTSSENKRREILEIIEYCERLLRAYTFSTSLSFYNLKYEMWKERDEHKQYVSDELLPKLKSDLTSWVKTNIFRENI